MLRKEAPLDIEPEMWQNPIAQQYPNQYRNLDMPTKALTEFRPIEKFVLNYFLDLANSCSPSELPESYAYILHKDGGNNPSPYVGSLIKAMDRLNKYGLLVDRYEKGLSNGEETGRLRRYYTLTPHGINTAIELSSQV